MNKTKTNKLQKKNKTRNCVTGSGKNNLPSCILQSLSIIFFFSSITNSNLILIYYYSYNYQLFILSLLYIILLISSFQIYSKRYYKIFKRDLI